MNEVIFNNVDSELLRELIREELNKNSVPVKDIMQPNFTGILQLPTRNIRDAIFVRVSTYEKELVFEIRVNDVSNVWTHRLLLT